MSAYFENRWRDGLVRAWEDHFLMSNPLRSLAPRGAKAIQRRVVQARQTLAPGTVRRLACVDGRTLQAVVETRAKKATVRLSVDHPAIGTMAPVEVTGRVHRFHVAMDALLSDPLWERSTIAVTVGKSRIDIATRAPSALLDGPTVAPGESWLTTVVTPREAAVTKNSVPPRVRLTHGTSTASGVSLQLPAQVSEVRLERRRDHHLRVFVPVEGHVELPLDELAERGWAGPDFWHASCVLNDEVVALVAPDDNIKNVHTAYNFPMLIVRDVADGLLYFAKPYFANGDRTLTIRTGIRADTPAAGAS